MSDAVGFAEQRVDALSLRICELNVPETAEFVEQANRALNAPVEDAGALPFNQPPGKVRNRLCGRGLGEVDDEHAAAPGFSVGVQSDVKPGVSRDDRNGDIRLRLRYTPGWRGVFARDLL